MSDRSAANTRWNEYMTGVLRENDIALSRAAPRLDQDQTRSSLMALLALETVVVGCLCGVAATKRPAVKMDDGTKMHRRGRSGVL